MYRRLGPLCLASLLGLLSVPVSYVFFRMASLVGVAERVPAALGLSGVGLFWRLELSLLVSLLVTLGAYVGAHLRPASVAGALSFSLWGATLVLSLQALLAP